MRFSHIIDCIVKKLFVSRDSYLIQSLKSTLTTSDWSVMKDGAPLFEARCLPENERKKAEEFAIDILSGKNNGVTLFAIEVLGELRSTQAYPHLKEYLKTAEGHTAAVLNALYQIDGSHEWIDVLFKELSHKNSNRRVSAVHVLLWIKSIDVKYDLIKELNNITDVDVLVRIYDHLLGKVFALYDDKSFFKSIYRKLFLETRSEAEDVRLKALNELNSIVKACMMENGGCQGSCRLS